MTLFPRFRVLLLLVLLSACAQEADTGLAVRYPGEVAEAVVSHPSPIVTAPSPDEAAPEIRRLRAALEAYHRIEAAGGWPVVPAGPNLEPGVRGGRVVLLRQRLAISGDDAAAAPDVDLFDDSLAAAVRRFQARHGLLVDGIVGRATLAALNVPVARRLASLRLNLDRMTGEARDWGARYIVVNVAAASYRLMAAGEPLLEGPAVVGKPSWPTPRIDSVVKRLEFNPYWNVPPRIARLEIWPRIRQDPSYLGRNHMRVINGRIRQDPGPGNPLGAVKFIFDNPYDVYLHDTNNRSLFERPVRFISHGCVRVSHAVELAKRLLDMNADWPERRIDEAIASGRNIRVDLARPIAIHIIYDTAWVDEAGIIQFRDDIYGRDRKFLAIQTSGAGPHSSSCGGHS